ncbi:uncharacterized protein LOC127263600 [Andrographis paniculata]|uniref:uncharacterized protein LOC127263600 n=1 Tax=Andrographis paniculata TaxID=175694 RepID=UPI0021E91280|nr:uncharacterized protein LOC127263600 [Andrographis paniculata]XP_051148662.1 uncharacterized protein LOC127263600 [Andrographis paniculata]
MSSLPTADADDAVAVAVADTVGKAPRRRFPPPCWTQEETLALIDAYRQRWYSLRRGYLRTPDWDAVAAAVANCCPAASPAKTSAQCRHKMEKLRQRYRAEKQRALSFPAPAPAVGRYFSSWFFFENMEAMENGTTHVLNHPDDDGSRLQSFLDQNILKLKVKQGYGADAIPDSGFNGHSFVKSNKRFNSATATATHLPGEYSLYVNKEEEEPPLVNGIPQPQLKPKPKPKIIGNKIVRSLDEVGAGIHQAPEMLPPRLTVNNFEKFNPIDSRVNPNHEYWVRFPTANSDRTKLRSNLWAGAGGMSNPTSVADSAGLKKRGRDDGVEEMVASIKMLGEGFVKVEKAKMEMAREMEVVRMEMEMKRNQMLLESQKQIVDAFLKGLMEMRKMDHHKAKKVVNTAAAAAATDDSSSPPPPPPRPAHSSSI